MQLLLRSVFLTLVVMALVPINLQAGAPSRFHDFAQVADGGGFRTLVLIMNQNGTAVTVTLKFFDSDGNPLSLTLDGTTGSEITVQIGADSTQILGTPGTAVTAATGWCNLTATDEVGAQVLFESINGETLISQAAVESLGPTTQVDIFVNGTDTSHTGFAVANLSADGGITVRLAFFDEAGMQVGMTTDLTLPARGHKATFVFQEIDGTLGKKGKLRITTSGSTAIVALQLTGPILGTLAPVLITL